MTNEHSSDRRQCARYTCDGSAEVQGALGSLRYRGKILDLSLSGCYLETAPPVRLERGSHVEISFQLNGLAFRVAATLTAMRNGGVGYSFSRLSNRTQGQLEMLIEEMKHELQKTKTVLMETVKNLDGKDQSLPILTA